MESFKSIDWNPSLNDIIDEEFVSGERLERESVMYRILRGTFTDPFADLHEAYKDQVTQEDIEEYEKSKEAEKEARNREREKAQDKEAEKKPKEEEAKPFKYHPGIVKSDVKYPRWSSLNQEQHTTCLKVLLQFSGPGKPDISKINREDLETYSGLQSIISAEQTEFLKVAKEHWNGSDLKLIREDLINRKWKHKMKYVEQLPRYYVETGTVPFTSDKEINVAFNAVAFETGTIPRLLLPQLTRRILVPVTSPKIENRYFTFDKSGRMKNLISEDPNCLNHLQAHDIDVVISSSGLNCLANNLDPSYKNSWSLPVVVKEINGKKIVFIDKPLPPTAKNVIQKNAWVYKYILKSFVLHPTHNTALHLNQNFIDLDKPQDDPEAEPKGQEEDPPAETNFSYNIFTIGACGLPQNELMKNKVERDYRLLVRTKTDGAERLPSKQIQCVMVAPKLEHQLGLGAEAVTLEEACKQWTALTFRPDTALIRVRINPTSSEVIQYERRTSISVNNEMKRLYNVKGEDSLHLIYNVAEAMTKLTPGRYLLKHTVRNGAFASIYKSADAPGKVTIDLEALYCNQEFLTLPNPPWPLIDKAVPLPVHECFSRMPAMFHPNRRLVKTAKRKPQNPPNQKKKTPKKTKNAAEPTQSAT